MTKKLSRRRGQVPRGARIYPEMTPRQAAFLDYLKTLGYGDGDVEYRPPAMARNLSTGSSTVVKKYTPTFFVAPELTVYDVGSKLSEGALGALATAYEGDGYEFRSVTEADFPFDEYVGDEEVASNEP